MLAVRYRGARRSVVLSSLARQGVSWRGKVLRGRALYSEVLHSKVRHGSILVWFRTVRSCPDWRGSAWHGIILALLGFVRSCPARLCKAWLFEVWYGLAGKSPVRLGQVELGSALCGKVLLWYGEVLIGAAGFIGALHSKVRSYCGMVWNREARHSIVKSCPVTHCYVLFGTVSLRSCIVWSGTVESGLARLRAAGKALVMCYFGSARLGDAESC